jgi:small subunit ribosomal protein S14
MAKTSSIEKNNKRKRLSKQLGPKRAKLKAAIMDQKLPLEERFQAQLKLAALPRNSAENRVHNRCELTGRPRGYYRKLKLSRIALRQLGSLGLIPGMVKSSW